MPPKKPKSDDVRSRKHLTPAEVIRVAVAAGKTGRHRHRDRHLIYCMFRHGFRVSEVIALRRDQFDLDGGDLHVKRSKRGKKSTHPVIGDEIRAMRKLFRDYPDSPFVFTSERKGPLTESAVFKMIARAGRKAGIPWPLNTHALRHACGYKLANEGKDTRAIQDYLGHASIASTEIYTQLSSERFKDFWEE